MDKKNKNKKTDQINNFLNKKKLNVVIFSTYGLPKVIVASNRIFGLTKGLSILGNKVHLITYRYKKKPYNEENNYSHCKELIIIRQSFLLTIIFNFLRKIHQIYKKLKNLSYTIINDNTIIENNKKSNLIGNIYKYLYWPGYYNQITGYSRRKNIINSIQNVINLLGSKFFVLITSHGPPACHDIGNIVKKKYGRSVFWIADYRDPMEYNRYSGVLTSKKLRQINTSTFINSDLITTVSNGMKKLLIKQANCYGVNITEKVILVYNGFNSYVTNKNSNSRIDLYNRQLIITYTGSLVEGITNPELLFKAISLLNKDLVKKIKIIYAGKNENIFLKYARIFGLVDIVKSLGFISKKEILEL